MKLKNFPWLSEDLFAVTCIDSADNLAEASEIKFFTDNGDWFVSQNEETCRVELGQQAAELETHGLRNETTWLLSKITDKTLFLQFIS